MARTIILELTDEQEQQLLRQAEKLNLSIESVLLRSLTQPLPPATVDEEYMLRFFLLSDLFNTVRAARLLGQTTAEVPVTETTLNLVQLIKGGSVINDFQLINREGQQYLCLHLSSESDRPTIAPPPTFDWTEPNQPPELAAILQNLNNEDPLIREQAVIALGELARES